MANGGIIGPVLTPASFNQSEAITTFNSSGTFTKQTYTNQVDVLLVAGGGGGASHFSPGGGGGGGILSFGAACAEPMILLI